MNTKPLKYPKDWLDRKRMGQRISVLTCYDAAFAKLLSQTEMDALLVGDSLGMVVQGNGSTLPVTLREMIYHAAMVKEHATQFVIADMPFGSYQSSTEDGLRNCIALFKEAKVDAVKLEGADENTLHIIRRLTEHGLPVMGHVGLTPQSYLGLGGYKVQGKTESAAETIAHQAHALQDAGCFSIVLELVTEELGKRITSKLTIPTIGIGSGRYTDGQVLVLHDMLGLETNLHPKHVKRYCNLAEEVQNAANAFHKDVQDGRFPAEDNVFHE